MPLPPDLSIEPENHAILHQFTVTAGHNIVKLRQKGVKEVLLRVNRLDGNFKHLPTNIDDWLPHKHEIRPTDVSVLNWVPPRNEFDVLLTPTAMLVTRKMIENKIVGIGNQ